jgi:hypothetical protein
MRAELVGQSRSWNSTVSAAHSRSLIARRRHRVERKRHSGDVFWLLIELPEAVPVDFGGDFSIPMDRQ